VAIPAPSFGPRGAKPAVLSFWNLIEAHVLRALRTDHGVTLSAARKAVDYAEKEFGIDRLLLSPELKSSAGHLFLERYGELVNLSLSGQLAMRKVLEAHLARVDYKAGFPVRLRPSVFCRHGACREPDHD
jgi:hypothetical protein